MATLHALLSLPPSSPRLSSFLLSLSSSASPPAPPTLKSYSDILYLSYQPLGLSLSFTPLLSSTPSFTIPSSISLTDLLAGTYDDKLQLSGIDVYNHATAPLPSSTKRTTVKKSEYDAFPIYPIQLPATTEEGQNVLLKPETTGLELVKALGEPQRKGGGGGHTPGMGIWTEWTLPLPVEEGDVKQQGGEKKEVKVMVEWASSGLQAWDKGGESGWRVLSVFLPE